MNELIDNHESQINRFFNEYDNDNKINMIDFNEIDSLLQSIDEKNIIIKSNLHLLNHEIDYLCNNCNNVNNFFNNNNKSNNRGYDDNNNNNDNDSNINNNEKFDDLKKIILEFKRNTLIVNNYKNENRINKQNWKNFMKKSLRKKSKFSFLDFENEFENISISNQYSNKVLFKFIKFITIAHIFSIV